MKKMILFAFLTTFSSALFSQQASVDSTEKIQDKNLRYETRAERKERHELDKEFENENKERARDLKKEMKAHNRELIARAKRDGNEAIKNQRSRAVAKN